MKSTRPRNGLTVLDAFETHDPRVRESAPVHERSRTDAHEVTAPRPEFPPSAVVSPDAISRRAFMTHLGASMALAGLGACKTRPADKILPYSRQPSEVSPGIPLRYATSIAIGGHGIGLLVETREGRPIKIEGNPDHPASLGASGVFEQASLLGLYDPHRAATLRERATPRSWDAFRRAFRFHESEGRGAGLRILLEPTSSPLAAHLLDRVRERYPDARVHFYDPLGSRHVFDASNVMFGRAIVPQLALDRARVILAVDSDLLCHGPFHLRYARQFAEGRHVRSVHDPMNRLYVVEAIFTPTGSIADHRIVTRCSEVSTLLASIAREVLSQIGHEATAPATVRDKLGALSSSREAPLVTAIARDLVRHRGEGLVIVGDRQPAVTHVLGHLLNVALGNIGRTLTFSRAAILEAGEESHDLAALTRDLEDGAVDDLLILGGNPAYSAARNLEFQRNIRRARRSAYLGIYENETAACCDWFLPEAHFLESWGDVRAYDGTISIIQPVIDPMFGGRTPHEVLASIAGKDTSARDLVYRFWRKNGIDRSPVPVSLAKQLGFGRGHRGAPDVSGIAPPETPPEWLSAAIFDESFALALKRGLMDGTAFAMIHPTIQWPRALAFLDVAARDTRRTPEDSIEIAFYPDHRVRDGGFTNNPWLLELPDPLTKLTWGNAAILSPATSRSLDIETGDLVAIVYEGRTLEAPAFVLPGHADGSVSIALGYGRQGAEILARGVGANAYWLRTHTAPYFDLGARVVKVRPARELAGTRHSLALTMTHGSMEGRPIALQSTLLEYRARPERWLGLKARLPSVRAEWNSEAPQWAMSIDLSKCMGCNACVIACQAENNVPVVGKINVQKSREMHWLRIDRYFTDASGHRGVVMQPMACQHCEKAPCEYVCPVNATVHSEDGLNEMVYNRCVGTRFCSNNCPYKVRRFNWFNFHRGEDPIERMAMNPDVTIRERGVMEKCTYCVQRIRRALIEARLEDRALRPGEVETACQQACPTRAIVFGDMKDTGAEVAHMRENERAYAVLHGTGTEPRTRYLVKLTNANPELEPAAAEERVAERAP